MLTEPDVHPNNKFSPSQVLSPAKSQTPIPSSGPGDMDFCTPEPTFTPSPQTIHDSPMVVSPWSVAHHIHTRSALQDSIAILPDPKDEEMNKKNHATQPSNCNFSPVSPGFPTPGPHWRLKSPPDLDSLESQDRSSGDADVPSEDSASSLAQPPSPYAQFSESPPKEAEFSLLPAIELESEIYERGFHPRRLFIWQLEARWEWSVGQIEQEQKEFIRRVKAQKQIYRKIVANLEKELQDFEEEDSAADGEGEEGELDDDEGYYDQDEGFEMSDESEEDFSSSSPESSHERYRTRMAMEWTERCNGFRSPS